MSVALTVTVVVITAGVAVSVLVGLVRACLAVRHRVPVPPRVWVALLQSSLFGAGGVFLLMTHGQGARLLSLFIMAGAALGLVGAGLARARPPGEDTDQG
ncbi:MAG: hypothetical protein V4671_05275 [Armatimonadota bacterium]